MSGEGEGVERKRIALVERSERAARALFVHARECGVCRGVVRRDISMAKDCPALAQVLREMNSADRDYLDAL